MGVQGKKMEVKVQNGNSFPDCGSISPRRGIFTLNLICGNKFENSLPKTISADKCFLKLGKLKFDEAFS